MAFETMTQDLKELLDGRHFRHLRDAFSQMNEVDVAGFIESLSPEEATLAFRTLPKDVEMDIFAELPPDVQQCIIEAISDKEIAHLIEELMIDDAVDMLEEMPAALVKRVLKNAAPETRALINQFLRYPENSAGSIMTAEFTDLHKSMTVEDAIKRIRRTGEDRETIYHCYVIDDTRHLEGVVSVKDLLLAGDGERVADMLEPDVIHVNTTADQEEAAKLMAKYGLIALPVVDAENRLVGIVTVDDALDVIREEDTEDFEKMAAMAPSERPYLKTSLFQLAKNRFPWLLFLMVSGIISESILRLYGPVTAAIPLLVTFIPMLNGTGGNAGSQSSTLVIRGMALGELHPKDFGVVVLKEARVGLLVGAGLAVVNWLRMLLTNPGQGMVSLVVSLTIMAAVLLAKMIGGTLPVLARALKLDPALMAAPLLSTLVDAMVLLVYFNVARLLLL